MKTILYSSQDLFIPFSDVNIPLVFQRTLNPHIFFWFSLGTSNFKIYAINSGHFIWNRLLVFPRTLNPHISFGILVGDPKFHSRPPGPRIFVREFHIVIRDIENIGVLNENMKVSNEIILVSKLNMGSAMKIWGSPTRIWGFPTRRPWVSPLELKSWWFPRNYSYSSSTVHLPVYV